MQINSIKTSDYSLIIRGNDGEEELVIQFSHGQSGSCDIQAIATSVDGGAGSRKHYWNVPYGDIRGANVPNEIRSILKEWGALAGTDKVIEKYLQMINS